MRKTDSQGEVFVRRVHAATVRYVSASQAFPPCVCFMQARGEGQFEYNKW